MSSTSGEELPLDSPQEQGQTQRAPRKNLLLTATIEAGSLKAPIRIRNLSETGALLEGAVFPNIGENLTLRRLDLEIGASIVWRTGSRCGVKFDGKASVAEWVSGKRSEVTEHRHQSRVDSIQAAIRAGVPVTTPTDFVSGVPQGAKEDLDRRLAEEVAYVRRLLENIGEELTNEPIVVQRHAKAFQSFDLACQILDHLSTIMRSEDRGSAVEAIGMEDLRARLLRKAIFRD